MHRRRIIKIMEIDAMSGGTALDEEQFAVLKKYSRSPYFDVRCEVAEVLGISDYAEKGAALLNKMTRDINPLVSAQACESLGIKGDASSIAPLMKRLKSRSHIVRGCAAVAAANVCMREGEGKEPLEARLRELVSSEKIPWSACSFRSALFILGDRAQLNTLLEGLKCGDKEMRLASADCLEVCIASDESVRSDIQRFMEENFTKGTPEYEELMNDIF